MPKPAPSREHAELLEILKRFPAGAAIEQLELGLDLQPTRRTLQRWLSDLIAQGVVLKRGAGRATRYFHGRARIVAVQEAVSATDAASAEASIHLSAKAAQIEAIVRQPIQKRTPIGYRQKFLDAYRPNVSFYLPASIRDELLMQGQAAQPGEPAGTYARHLAHRLLIDLSWNSSRLEGNTYSLLETERLLSEGEAAVGRNAREAQMILNHKGAIEFLISSANEIGFNNYTILNLHALLSDNLLDDPTASGRLRKIGIGIAQSVFFPLEGPQRIEECFAQILDTAAAIQNPFEQAFFAMVHLPYLQPFEDVNKRVSRLAANIPLIQRNLCPLSFVDVPQQVYISALLGVYELNRIELLREVFVWAYKRSCARYSAVRQSLGEPDPFRIQYRAVIAETVADVVRGVMDKTQAIVFVRQQADSQLPASDRARFVEIAETQLLSLHEGNIARYRLRPSEFQLWRASWK